MLRNFISEIIDILITQSIINPFSIDTSALRWLELNSLSCWVGGGRKKEKKSSSSGVEHTDSPVTDKVDVPLWVDDDAEDISDLLSSLLDVHVVLPQNHTVNISRPE